MVLRCSLEISIPLFVTEKTISKDGSEFMFI